MSTDLAVLEPREVVITNEQTDLIKRTICQGATDAEMKLFFFDCQRRGTHPLDKLIHFTKRDGKYTPVTSIDFFRLRAHSSGAYAGEGATTYEIGEDGLPNECTVSVLRLVQGQLCTWRATARWDEYYPGEKSGFMWRKMPYLMLAKCAEALALRKAFPAELQGLYVKEEMEQAGPVIVKEARGEGSIMPAEAVTVQPGSPVGPAHNEALSVFDTSSAIADHETALDECKTADELQKAWDDVVKDHRLTSESRPGLYKKMQKLAAGFKVKK